MPIKIPDKLPARHLLEIEGVMVMDESVAIRQDIRPLRIGLLNLMPDKIITEIQIARLLGATALQIELTLVRITEHISRNTPADHMAAFYRPWSDISAQRFDGFIITGAPVERLPYADVGYWTELRSILDWTQTHVHRCFTICWAAQAALFHFHGIPKRDLSHKAFGVFEHRNLTPSSPYLRGFPDAFDIPVSRWTEVCPKALAADEELTVLASSTLTGAGLVEDRAHGFLHMFNHLEYDTGTLADEYHRDSQAQLPTNYFPNDDPEQSPQNRWRGHAHLLFANWINEIYQTTLFDFAANERMERSEF